MDENITDMVVIPMMLAQYGRPMTVLRATQGVKTITETLRRLRSMYEKLAKHLTSLE